MKPTREVLRNVLQPILRDPQTGFVPISGPELVTNGGFASATGWTVGAQWSIGSGVASKTATGSSLLQQSIAIVPGRAYTVTFTITATSVAGDGMSVFLGQTSGAIRTAPGTYTQTIVPSLGTNLDFVARGATEWQGSIDNVSVKSSIV